MTMERPLNNNDHDLLIRVDSKVGQMASVLDEIKTSLKGLPGIFASKDIAMQTEERLAKLEIASEGPKKYIIPVVTAIGSSVVTFLIISYFEHGI